MAGDGCRGPAPPRSTNTRSARDGRVVADVVRESKGHTEGLEPHITEKLVQMMLSAKPTKRK